MIRKLVLASLTFNILLLLSCSSKKSAQEKETIDVIGTWSAQWETDPASYPGVDASIDFTMDGQFDFNDEGKVTISAYGHPGCIFSSDTLIHSLNWKLKNDTLQLVNDNDIHGMTYSVMSLDNEKMKLKLMDDIFLNLTKNR